MTLVFGAKKALPLFMESRAFLAFGTKTVALGRKTPPLLAYTIFTNCIKSKGGVLFIERSEIFQAIVDERKRQEKLHPMPKLKTQNDPDITAVQNLIVSAEFLAVLTEEFGEVGKALQGDGDLKEELIQVASVTVRWLETLK